MYIVSFAAHSLGIEDSMAICWRNIFSFCSRR